MSAFASLPTALRAELIRICPGRRIRIPKREHIPEIDILAAVLGEMDLNQWSQWRACVRVAGRLELHRDTVWKIVQRRRSQARCAHPGQAPEYGGR